MLHLEQMPRLDVAQTLTPGQPEFLLTRRSLYEISRPIGVSASIQGIDVAQVIKGRKQLLGVSVPVKSDIPQGLARENTRI